MLFFSYRTAQFFAPSSYYLPNLLQLFKHFLRQETKHRSVFTLTFFISKTLNCAFAIYSFPFSVHIKPLCSVAKSSRTLRILL